MHILLVDDNTSIRASLSCVLAQLGHTFEVANNGLAALEKAKAACFDLYIIDHLMPVMNGIKLVKNLKSKVFTSNTPIIFMTTQDVSIFDNSEELPLFDTLIAKPINEDLFIEKVNNHLFNKSIVHSL
ncbi:response regulator [Colwelliaceae bacterium 6441]